jgi:hypothetical protein
MHPDDAADPARANLRELLLDILARHGEKTLSAPEIARVVTRDDNWSDLLAPIRRTAVELALAGHLIIYRKGKPVDPREFKGVYRPGLPRHD